MIFTLVVNKLSNKKSKHQNQNINHAIKLDTCTYIEIHIENKLVGKNALKEKIPRQILIRIENSYPFEDIMYIPDNQYSITLHSPVRIHSIRHALHQKI